MRITWKGVDPFRQEKIGFEARRRAFKKVSRALYREAQEVMKDSKARYVPVDSGTLRSSGHVKRPTETQSRISITLGYGGAAKKYALYQHEAMGLRHKVGGPKYLQRPLQARVEHVEVALARAVRDALK